MAEISFDTAYLSKINASEIAFSKKITFRKGTVDPNGVVFTPKVGDFYLNTTTNTWWFSYDNGGTIEWVQHLSSESIPYYTTTILVADWVGAGPYTFTILKSTHGVFRPIISCFDDTNTIVNIEYSIDGNEDIVFTSNVTLDLTVIIK